VTEEPPATAANRIPALGRAVAEQPGKSELHFELGAAMFAAGDPAGAARSWAEAARLRPGWMAAHAN
jgi:cytochrome c-type biogenesis protein CcmH/NrfG